MSEIPQEENVKKEIEDIIEIKSPTKRAIKYMLYSMRSQLFWDRNKRTSTVCANKKYFYFVVVAFHAIYAPRKLLK